MLFKENLFMENIGTLGGSVHIMSPDFETNKDSNATNSQPYIYFKDNNFTKNMAYFAGNALYITHTINRTEHFKDYRYMCGAGVNIENNSFEYNTGLKRHNGGASVHRCLLYDSDFKGKRLSTSSSLELLNRTRTDDDVGNFTYWYEDPMKTKDNFTDLSNSNITYEVYKYATNIKHNSFIFNSAGMKGSALLISLINALHIDGNLFLGNQPVGTWSERPYSPYFKYFAHSKKLISYYSSTCPRSTEVEFYAFCYSDLGYIDSPALEGAVYIENCNDSFECFSPVDITWTSDQMEQTGQTLEQVKTVLTKFAQEHQYSTPFRSSELERNIFDLNYALSVFINEQDY